MPVLNTLYQSQNRVQTVPKIPLKILVFAKKYQTQVQAFEKCKSEFEKQRAKILKNLKFIEEKKVVISSIGAREINLNKKVDEIDKEKDSEIHLLKKTMNKAYTNVDLVQNLVHDKAEIVEKL